MKVCQFKSHLSLSSLMAIGLALTAMTSVAAHADENGPGNNENTVKCSDVALEGRYLLTHKKKQTTLEFRRLEGVRFNGQETLPSVYAVILIESNDGDAKDFFKQYNLAGLTSRDTCSIAWYSTPVVSVNDSGHREDFEFSRIVKMDPGGDLYLGGDYDYENDDLIVMTKL